MATILPGKVVHAQVVDEKAAPDQVVQVLHDGTSQKQHLSPFMDENHLPLDV